MNINFYTKIFFPALAVVLVLTACNFNQAAKGKIKVPSLSPKYNYRDKEPMGSFLAYQSINKLFDNAPAVVKSKSFANQWYDLSQDNTAYLVISKSVYLSKNDIYYLLNYVSNGNTAFISADYIDEKLMDTLGITMYFDYFAFYNFNEYRVEKKDTWVSIADKQISNGKKYGIFWLPFEGFFYDYDSAATQVISHNENGKANMIALNYGKGKFIFHAAPAVFSNYFLLKPGNQEYFENIFSYLSPKTNTVYWDNYYRVHKGTQDFSISDFFKKSESLYPAFLLLLGLLLLYIAFGSKRIQRFVPEKILPANSTVSYTETIGRLYLQKKDNRNIAQKMITYFLESVRNNYFLNTKQLNNEFAAALSRKSGVSENHVINLLQLIEEINNAGTVNDIKLLELHNNLQLFLKK